MNVVLIGFMATGKTTVAGLLAKKLGWAAFDCDAWVEKAKGMSVARIFEKEGEAEFRRAEAAALEELAGYDHAVISTGGGAPLSDENMRTLEKNGFVVWLSARPDTVLERLKTEGAKRPLLAGKDPAVAVKELLAKREKAYARHHASVKTDGRTPEQVAEEIFKLVKERK